MRGTCKLILVEGLCGTGKSTLAERLHVYLTDSGVASRFYDEGAKEHPVSLNGHAFFREAEYKELLERYPSAVSEIILRAIRAEDHYLIPYYEPMTAFAEWDQLYSELQSLELCWTDSPVATLPEFTRAIQGNWARFAERAKITDEVYVLEAVFLQHQIHDLLGLYGADDDQIRQHIMGIAERIAGLHPVLIYLSQREQQTWISLVRSKPLTEQKIAFMEKRKRIEVDLIERLPFPTDFIENEKRDWNKAFRRMVEAVAQREKILVNWQGETKN